MVESQQVNRWRLILGSEVESQLEKGNSAVSPGIQLSEEELAMDQALQAIYNPPSSMGSTDCGGGQGAGRAGGSGSVSPVLSKLLTDIKSYFPEEVVSLVQEDLIRNQGLLKTIKEPEFLSKVQPSVQLVTMIMSLKDHIPDEAKKAARDLVQSVVEEIKLELEQALKSSVCGALNKKAHSPIPRASNIDWKWTIERNLKNWNPTLNKLIPEKVWFYSNTLRVNDWTVILDLDQSGSMAESMVYGAVLGSIFASIPALKTHVVAFSTEVVDLTEQCAQDPVDLLLGVQLGGGTDINKSVAYCEELITEPRKTLFIILSDFFEGGNQAQFVRRVKNLIQQGVTVLGLLALSDSGKPAYDEKLARKISKVGAFCFGCTPKKLPEVLAAALSGSDLTPLMTDFEKGRKR